MAEQQDFDSAVLELLACPAAHCRGRLQAGSGVLHCEKCGRRYRLDRAIPVLILAEAITADSKLQPPRQAAGK